jgi:hypothetical protein
MFNPVALSDESRSTPTHIGLANVELGLLAAERVVVRLQRLAQHVAERRRIRLTDQRYCAEYLAEAVDATLVDPSTHGVTQRDALLIDLQRRLLAVNLGLLSVLGRSRSRFGCAGRPAAEGLGLSNRRPYLRDVVATLKGEASHDLTQWGSLERTAWRRPWNSCLVRGQCD